MISNKDETQGGDVEFDTFWKNFQLLSWKWTDRLARHSKYLIATVLIIYAFTLIITYLPDNPLLKPEYIQTYTEDGTEDEEGMRLYDKLNGRLLLLKQYKSIHLVIVSAMGVIVLVIRWRYLISEFFQWLWDGRRLGEQSQSLKSEYLQFLKEYQSELKKKWVPALIGIVLIGLFIWLAHSNEMFPFFQRLLNDAAIKGTYIMLAIAVFWLFMLGQYSWALYTTSKYVGKLSKRFEIKIQPNHPDKCGGLQPLGNFCLETILPLLAIGILFAVVSVFELDVDTVSQEFATVYLFVLAAPLAVLSVFVPVWNVHETMVDRKRKYLDTLGTQIKALEEIIHIHTQENGDISKAKEANEKLEILQTVHSGKMPYPVWPFRFTPTVLAIFSPQILQTILGIISSLLGLLGIEI